MRATLLVRRVGRQRAHNCVQRMLAARTLKWVRMPLRSRALNQCNAEAQRVLMFFDASLNLISTRDALYWPLTH